MLAVPRLSENQTVTAGPWTIVPTYKTNKLQSCTMSRSDGELGATFVRTQDGLSVILEFAEVEASPRQDLSCSSHSRHAIRGCQRPCGNEKCDYPACR